MNDSDIRQALDDIRSLLVDLSRRVTVLEGRQAPGTAPPLASAVSPAPVVPSPPEPALTEDVVIAITAAVAAFLGERAHVRQIRLISSSAWAQQGRVFVQASHWLDR
jgi:methylmalonyl-CoA carboxyltransferase large subunit